MQTQKSTIFTVDDAPVASPEGYTTARIVTDVASNITVDATCNHTITISCILQLYNAEGYVPSNNPNNSIAVAGYLVRTLSPRQTRRCTDRRFLPRRSMRTYRICSHSMQNNVQMPLIRPLLLYLLLVRKYEFSYVQKWLTNICSCRRPQRPNCLESWF